MLAGKINPKDALQVEEDEDLGDLTSTPLYKRKRTIVLDFSTLDAGKAKMNSSLFED
jgi:hypothetical protein